MDAGLPCSLYKTGGGCLVFDSVSAPCCKVVPSPSSPKPSSTIRIHSEVDVDLGADVPATMWEGPLPALSPKGTEGW